MGLALQWSDRHHHLVVINQKPGKHNVVFDTLLEDPHPFTTTQLQTTHKGPLRKRRSKSQAFSEIRSLVENLHPERIFTGSDRHVEFQYAMHTARRLKFKTQGCYLDDGSSSYVNARYLHFWRSLTDLTVDHLLKKCFYGTWFHKHLLYGGTKWVSECYLNFPQFAPEALKQQKKIIGLAASTYTNEAFRKSTMRFFPSGDAALKTALSQQYDAFLVLPHSRFVNQYFKNADAYNRIVDEYLKSFTTVAVKYHPREDQRYFTSHADITELPAELPAEIIFSWLKAEMVVGDLSSAVLSALWLLPHCEAVCLVPAQLQNNPFIPLIKQAGARIHTID